MKLHHVYQNKRFRVETDLDSKKYYVRPTQRTINRLKESREEDWTWAHNSVHEAVGAAENLNCQLSGCAAHKDEETQE